MATSKARSTACKVACAWLLTALVIQNTFQNGVYIPVSAEEQDDLTLQDWEERVITVADEWLANYMLNTNNPGWISENQAYVYTALAWKSAVLYTNYVRSELGDGASTIPAGSTYFGWFYYGDEPKSGTIFVYGQNGDRVQAPASRGEVTFFTSDVFTAVGKYTNPLPEYSTFIATSTGSQQGAFLIYNFNIQSIIWTSVSYSAVFESNDPINNYSVYFRNPSTSPVNLRVDVSGSYYFRNSPSPTGTILGTLKNTTSQGSRVMIPAVANTPQDISDSIYNTLLSDYPAIEDIYFPAGGADVPDMSGFDFPPDLPAVSFNAPEMPSQSLPEGMLSGAGFWFTQFGNLLDGLGVKYIVIIIMIAVLLLSILKF